MTNGTRVTKGISDTNAISGINTEIGLTDEQVAERVRKGLVNKCPRTSQRSVLGIIVGNIFTFFNFINTVLALAIIFVGSYMNMLFYIIVVVNTGVGIFQELRAKITLDRLFLLVKAKAVAVRNAAEKEIDTEEVVLDDILVLKSGDQICSDAILTSGILEVNESLLTGESETVIKNPEDNLYSGSYVTSGKAYARVIHIGADNYAQKITAQAKAVKKRHSELRRAMDKILKIVSIIILPLGIALFCMKYFIGSVTFGESVIQTVAAMVGMIPEGLILLTSTALAVGAIHLARKRTLVHELFCIETLARVDMLCLDKTGTITEGKMRVNKIIEYPIHKDNKDHTDHSKSSDSGDSAEEIIGNILHCLPDCNSTFLALKDRFLPKRNYVPLTLIPFSSERKYSGVCFADRGTYLLGAFEFLFPDTSSNNEESAVMSTIRAAASKYSAEGIRVITLAHSRAKVNDPELKELPSGLKPCALILISDVIRKNAPKTIKYFKDQNVELTVISGDHPAAVAFIASRAGIEDAEKYIDASTLTTDEEIADAAEKYRVFGRTSPHQKRKIIKALQKLGNTVAMTGDGVNDVPALKQADCSIAMAAGSDAAKGCSDLVLLDSNFAALPYAINQGRRVINNIQSAASLFLVKTQFSIAITALILLTGMVYPFVPLHLTLIGACAVGIPTFILSFEPNYQRIKSGFLRNVAQNAMTGAAVVMFNIMSVTIAAMLLGLSDNAYQTMCIISTGITSIYMIKLVFPLRTLLRKLIYSLMFALFISGLVLFRTHLDLTNLPYGAMILLLALVLLTPRLIALSHLILKRLLQWTDTVKATKKRDKKLLKSNTV